MDPLTHLLLTRAIVGKQPRILLAGIVADAPFYLTYPPWLLQQGKLSEALRTNDWPQAPAWMYTAHNVAHSLPIIAMLMLASRLRDGAWPRWCLAWLLHILIDIPTHSRQQWAPQFLWPLSDVTVDGVSWPRLLVAAISRRSPDTTVARNNIPIKRIAIRLHSLLACPR